MNLKENRAPTDGEMVEVVLEGGPHGIPRSMRAPLVSALDRIKVQYLNGYEHFELDPATADSVPMHFYWTMQTKIAE